MIKKYMNKNLKPFISSIKLYNLNSKKGYLNEKLKIK